MAEIEEDKRRIVVKIVYYGPALGGKTTNLIRLHDLLNPAECGDVMSFDTKGDRTLFFDLLPVVFRSESDYSIKIKLFTVPGQVAHDATRKAVLSRADAVVFVADSQVSQSLSNSESFENLERNARQVGLDFEKLPLVIQFNKRDLHHIVSEEEVMDRWRATSLPVTFSSALYGRGVLETFAEVLKNAFPRLDELYGLIKRYGIRQEDFMRAVDGKDERF